MKIRIPGGYTGYHGALEFKDGVSVGLASPRQANTLRAVQAGVEVLEDDGVTVDEGLNTLFPILPRSFYIGAGLPLPSQFLTEFDGSYGYTYVDATYAETETVSAETGEPVPAEGKYSREDLEAIVDEKGIGGLRDIADPMGVKGNSIRGLIDAILAAQGQ